MILSKEQIEKRLTSEDNIANKVEDHKNDAVVIYKDGINNHKGKNGSSNLTENERVAIGVIASVGGDQLAADLFGVNKSHVNDLKNGNRNISNDNLRIRDIDLQEKIAERLENTKLSIQEVAATKLLKSMGLLTEDKLENSSAKELAQVSTQMSQVIRNMNNTNSNKDTSKANVKIVVHSPKQSNEDSFDTLELRIG